MKTVKPHIANDFVITRKQEEIIIKIANSYKRKQGYKQIIVRVSDKGIIEQIDKN